MTSFFLVALGAFFMLADFIWGHCYWRQTGLVAVWASMSFCLMLLPPRLKFIVPFVLLVFFFLYFRLIASVCRYAFLLWGVEYVP